MRFVAFLILFSPSLVLAFPVSVQFSEHDSPATADWNITSQNSVTLRIPGREDIRMEGERVREMNRFFRAQDQKLPLFAAADGARRLFQVSDAPPEVSLTRTQSGIVPKTLHIAGGYWRWVPGTLYETPNEQFVPARIEVSQTAHRVLELKEPASPGPRLGIVMPDGKSIAPLRVFGWRGNKVIAVDDLNFETARLHNGEKSDPPIHSGWRAIPIYELPAHLMAEPLRGGLVEHTFEYDARTLPLSSRRAIMTARSTHNEMTTMTVADQIHSEMAADPKRFAALSKSPQIVFPDSFQANLLGALKMMWKWCRGWLGNS